MSRAPKGYITVRDLADALPGLTLDQVRGLVDRGTILSTNAGFGTKRFVPVSEVHRLRERGFTVLNVQAEQE